jgi:hypothetical protein
LCRGIGDGSHPTDRSAIVWAVVACAIVLGVDCTKQTGVEGVE